MIGIFLACGSSPSTETAEASDDRQLYLRGVVVDTARGEVFALDEERRLQALDLASGELLWRGDKRDAPAPVARFGRLLAGLQAEEERNRFRLAFQNLERRGEILSWSNPVELPSWVSVVEQRGRSFGLRPRIQGGLLEIEWTARSWYAGGARPTPEVLAEARREARGRIVVDPSRSTATVEPKPTLEEGARSSPYWEGSGFTEAPFHIEGAPAVLVLSPADGGEALSLRRLDGPRQNEDIPLETGRGIKAQLTADGGHLLVSSFSPQGSESLALFSLSPIARLLKLPPSWPLHAGVADSRLFQISTSKNPARRRLEVIRLADGKELWSVPLPTPDLGPMPR